MRKLLPINKLLLTITIIMYIIILSIYGYWDYSYNKNEIMENIDSELYNSASALKYILPEDFHDRAIDKHAISIKEDKEIAKKITNLINETSFKYAYTIVKKGGELFFIAGDLIEDPKTQRGTFYFYPYEEAGESFFKAFNQEVPTYKTVSDQWGTVRTVMIPEKSPGGVKYLACVDYDISYVKKVLQKNFLRSIVISLFFVFLAVPILIIYTKLHNKYSDSLKESEEKYRSLANNLNVGIYRNSVGSKGRFIEANPAIVKMFGFNSREEFLGLNISDLYKNSEDRTAFKNELLKENEIKNKEFQLQKKDGTIIIGSVSAVAVKDENKKLQYFDGVIEDITERKHAEKALSKSENKYRMVFEKSVDAIFVVDRVTGRYLEVNKAGEKLTGRSSSELKKMTTAEVTPEGATHRLKDILLMSKTSNIGEAVYVQPDGTEKAAILTAVSLDEKTVYGIAHDITDRKRVEEEKKKLKGRLVQAQKMESIGTLAGGIAHDFNNILFPIVGHTEMLIKDVPENSPLQKGLNRIYTGALRATDLVKQILTFSRQESGELKLMKIQPIIKEALKLIRSTIPTTIDIKQYISNDCGMIKADPTQVHQIVMNLATNAYHAVEKAGGELNIKLTEVELGETDLFNPDIKPGSYAWLSISDTGKGMDKDTIKKIFDPFFTTKKTGKGTGMGLSVVHGIVKNMNGGINVHSKPDKGTEFK
jgi:PAS domain S-box-containing protein